MNEHGQTPEQGEATPSMKNEWKYAPAAHGKIVIEAKDLAGNVARREAE